jgi:hypothetical protein
MISEFMSVIESIALFMGKYGRSVAEALRSSEREGAA